MASVYDNLGEIFQKGDKFNIEIFNIERLNFKTYQFDKTSSYLKSQKIFTRLKIIVTMNYQEF